MPDIPPEVPENAAIQFDGPAPYLPAIAWIRGFPGFRTRPGRSGYDPLDQDFELAHIQGVLLKVLFTGRLRTRNPAYLVLLVVMGVVFCLPMVFLAGSVVWIWVSGLKTLGDWVSGLAVLLLFSPSIALGLAIFWNIGLSLMLEEVEHGDDLLVIE